MNLIDKFVPKIKDEYDENIFCIRDFRKQQFQLIPILIENVINYLNKLSNNYIKFKNIKQQQMIKYLDIYGYSVSKYIVNIENPDDPTKEQVFLSFNLPNLIKNNFFYLYGSYYTPCIFISDKPIVNKKNSIKLTGLVNSITIFLKKGISRVIFGGKNIPLEYFLQWFLSENEDLLDIIEDTYKFDKTRYSYEHLENYFKEFFECEDGSIDEVFTKLFFDEYTQKIYETSYGINFTFRELVVYAIKNYLDEENEKIFVDLNEKRLTFIEVLLTPLFQRIGVMAFNFIKGQKFSSISFNEDEILKYFMMDLKHQFFYDLVNFYSGIVVHKASFLSPNSKNPPREISSIHPTHLGRICPITVSAKKPGESVSIVPSTKINNFGLFV